jgi:hypothetical protein
VGLEGGPLSLVSTIEELLGRNSSGSGLENREYSCGDPLHWPRDTLYQQKMALTSPTSGGRSVGIVRFRNKTTGFFFVYSGNLNWTSKSLLRFEVLILMTEFTIYCDVTPCSLVDEC